MGLGRPIAIPCHTGTLPVGGGFGISHVHCVGMAGSGMQAITEWLVDAGFRLTGSDNSASPEQIARYQKLRAKLLPGHSPHHVPDHLDWLIYSPAISADNPERLLARQRGVQESSLSQAIGQLMRGQNGISIAGTHGKSTTTALLGHILKYAGRDPSILCGARMRNLDRSGVRGTSDLFVVESCEYRGHFLDLTPRSIGLLGIEPDHFDCFPRLEDAVAIYDQFVSRLPNDGVLVVNFDCELSRKLSANLKCRKISVSTTDDDSDYLVTRVSTTARGLSLTVRFPEGESLDLKCPLTGNHHAVNIATALAMAIEHGVSPAICAEAMVSFRGISRRFEVRLGDQGVTWVDDYAHHPSAVHTLIDAARDRFPNRRICCVFQPHQVSRTRELASDFAKALSRADDVLVLPVFGARETAVIERIQLSSRLVGEVSNRGVPAQFVSDLDHLRTTLETHLRPGDVVLTVGAGDIDRIYHEFTGRLRRHHAS